MKMWRQVMVAALGGALALGACGDSDKKTTGGTAEGDAGSTLSCVGDLVPVAEADATSTKPEYDCDDQPSTKMPDSGNACRNTSDCDIIASDAVREIARVCGLSCRGAETCDKLDACNKKCVTDTTAMNVKAPGLSSGCASCYAGVSGCVLDKCLSECAADADAPECVKCSFVSGCRIPFEECSGLDRK